ncbi:hypothetical protein [Paenibacillus sp. CAA11]|uniref:hypothetical protein n=1 Tax=Paenibacillus sp. CAA11 TaxID=1532905 RepID=UPI001F459082|nr:hypothetical protein [Paenibacillus sp. CAA11]
MPTRHELSRLTGRNFPDIEAALNSLMLAEYIFWPDKPALDTIVILEGWERETPTKPTTNANYWTEY